MATGKKPTVTSFATSPTIGGYTGPKNVTPAAPNLGLGKITTPVAVNIGGSIITLPAPNLAPVQKTPIAPSLPPVQKTPIASLRPTVDKSEEKKPLEWGFKGRKRTDIVDIDYVTTGDRRWDSVLDDSEIRNRKNRIKANSKKLERVANKNKFIKQYEYEGFYPYDMNIINAEFSILEAEDVPRELTGKMIGNKLGKDFLIEKNMLSNNDRSFPKIYGQKESIRNSPLWQDWKTGWLRFYNELGKDQQETFQVLSDNWLGSPNELVDVVKVLGTYKT